MSYPQVEGAEVLVLQGFDFKRYCIRFMTIEHNGYEPMRSDIRDLMEAAGHAYAGRDGFDELLLYPHLELHQQLLLFPHLEQLPQ